MNLKWAKPIPNALQIPPAHTLEYLVVKASHTATAKWRGRDTHGSPHRAAGHGRRGMKRWFPTSAGQNVVDSQGAKHSRVRDVLS